MSAPPRKTKPPLTREELEVRELIAARVVDVRRVFPAASEAEVEALTMASLLEDLREVARDIGEIDDFEVSPS
jgi:hypothetical protein